MAAPPDSSFTTSRPAADPAPPGPSAGDGAGRDDLACPLCDYSLRGLTDPRCPECGHVFDWAELTDPNRRRHPYLFEHHPERNAWSFRRTAIGALRPGTFWRELRPAQAGSAGRLGLYALITTAAAITAVVRPLVEAYHNPGTGLIASFSYYWHEGLLALADVPPWGWRRWRTQWGLFDVALYVAWAPATFLLLLIFQASMGRARVKVAHVARCVVYSLDTGMWLGPVLAALFVISWTLNRPVQLERTLSWVTLVGGAAVFLISTWRLYVSYRLYLRFEHPLATVVATQVIFVLAAATVIAR